MKNTETHDRLHMEGKGLGESTDLSCKKCYPYTDKKQTDTKHLSNFETILKILREQNIVQDVLRKYTQI
jgi:hypothetical protein